MLSPVGARVTIGHGRFAGRTGKIVDVCGEPGEVWVAWQEGSFKTLSIERAEDLREV